MESTPTITSVETIKNYAIQVFASTHKSKSAILPSVCAKAVSKSGENVGVRILLDPCSSSNFITTEASKKLQNKILQDNVDIVINTINGKVDKTLPKIQIQLVNPKMQFKLDLSVLVLDNIANLPPITISNEEIYSKIKNKKINLNENYPRDQVNVDILVGVSDLVKLIGSKIKPVSDDLLLMTTKWGYILMGSETIEQMSNDKNETVYFTKSEILTKQLERMWKLDNLPFDDDKSGLSKEEVDAVSLVNKVCVYNPYLKKFETNLLFKTAPKLQNNYASAKARLNGMLRKMKQDSSLSKGYNDVINDYLKEGIIEEVIDQHFDDPKRTDVYYLPHRVIVDNTRVTTKHRVVFDASQKCPDGKSLNSCIMCGPKLQQDILAILVRFRSSIVTLISDVSKMFLNCNIKGKDKDFLRFLYKNPLENQSPLKIYRFTTLVFGVTDSPFQSLTCLQKLVKRKLQDPHITQYEKKACDVIENDMYIDDVTTTCQNEAEAIKVRKALTDILAEGSFHIRKWVSNSSSVLDTIPEKEKAPLTNVVNRNGVQNKISDTTKQLGYRYDPLKDLFLFDSYDELIKKNDNTMRSVASLLASIYDPIGFICPYILLSRFILKGMFQKKLSWNDSIPKDLLPLWKSWLSELPELKTLVFPRYVPTNHETSTFIIASDASESGYGCCAYTRTYNEKNKVYDVNLLLAKSRVSPVTNLTIPQLELKAAYMAAQMANYLHNELKVSKDRMILFSDSRIVLCWMERKVETLTPFVYNRIHKIHDLKLPKFRYIHTSLNPSDILSRGANLSDLKSNELWLSGPGFWKLSQDQWPVTNEDFGSMHITEGIRKKEMITFFMLDKPLLRKPLKNKENDIRNFFRIPMISYYSNFDQMVRKIAFIYYVLHCFSRNKDKKRKLSFDENNNSHFHEYIQKARNFWYKFAQRQSYDVEITCLEKNKPIPAKSTLKELNPFLDKGILRVGGRLQEADLPYTRKHPIILPKKSKITWSIAMNAHIAINHFSKSALYSRLLQDYYIPQGRQLVNSIVRACVYCNRIHAARATQLMGQNPKPRLTLAMPWYYVGVDLTGKIPCRKFHSTARNVQKIASHPAKIKSSPEMQDCYVILFTDLSTRAVHLELALSNHEEEFLNAFIRFSSICGMGYHFYSDGATYFHAAVDSLRKEMRKKNKKLGIHDQLQFEWHFQTSRAGHVGGLWERLIGMVKNSLYKVTRNAALTYQELSTVICQLAASCNDRPLQPLAGDDTATTLTPSMLTLGRKIVPWVDEFSRPKQFVSEDLTVRWKLRQQISKRVWQLFLDEYLVELQKRNKWFSTKPNLKPGDLVVVEKKNIKRHDWPIMKVVDVHVNRSDGRVRSVKLYKAYEKHPYTTRTIHQIFPLEAVNTEHNYFPNEMYDEKIVLPKEQAETVLHAFLTNESKCK